MIAFEVEIDGVRRVCAGVEDWSLLTLHMTASRREEAAKYPGGYMELTVGALTLPDPSDVRHHVRWGMPTPFEIGSVVTVRVVDLVEADPPSKRYRSDSEVQESPFTDEEERAMRYQDYLDLKAEFEVKG